VETPEESMNSPWIFDTSTMVLISRATLVKSKEIKPIHCKRLAKLELTTIPREYSLNADFRVEQKKKFIHLFKWKTR
jgi:hypothetical protein